MAAVPVDAIVKAVEGLYWVYNNCFNELNSADIHYRRFGRKVENFINSGRRLHGTITKASRSRSKRREIDFVQEAQAFVEEFEEISRDCQAFLRSKKPFKRNKTNAIENFEWKTSAAPRVIRLQERMAQHENDLMMFVKSYELDDQETKLDELLTLARKLHGIELVPDVKDFPVPPDLIERFEIAKMRNPPRDDCFMAEALIAAEGHLGQSTKLSAPEAGQSVYQFINLYKAHWMLLLYRALQSSEGALNGANNRRAADLEEQIVQELIRKDLVQYKEQDFIHLPDSAFFVWVSQEFNSPPMDSAPQNREKLIFEANLPAPNGARGCTLSVFRQVDYANARSFGTSLRIVTAWQMFRRDSARHPSTQLINTFQDDIYPTYLFSRSLNDQFALDLRCNKSRTSIRYDFNSAKDLYRFQSALTCYVVASDIPTAKWTAPKSLKKEKNMPSGLARLQIWLWDPDERLLKPASRSPSQALSDRSSGDQSILSTVTSPMYPPLDPDLDVFPDKDQSPTEQKRRKYSTTDIFQTVLPYPPVLVLFNQDAEKRSYICLDIKDGLDIDQKRCECSAKPDLCKRAVLRKPKGSEFKAVRVYSDSGDLMSLPSLSLLAKSERKGEKPHPQLQHGPSSEVLEMSEIVVSFPEVDTRRKFVKEFTLTYQMRQQAVRADNVVEDAVRHRASLSGQHGSFLTRISTDRTLLG